MERPAVACRETNTEYHQGVAESGGDAVPLTTRDANRRERLHGGPIFLPDGRHFLYSRFSSVPENNGLYVGSLDGTLQAGHSHAELLDGTASALSDTSSRMLQRVASVVQ